MITAKKMFEELGFEKVGQNIYTIYYQKKRLELKIDIEFWFDIKTYDIRRLLDGKEMPVNISIKLHKAITQQMKELGWLE